MPDLDLPAIKARHAAATKARRPTIAELEKLLLVEDQVDIQPDGTVLVEDERLADIAALIAAVEAADAMLAAPGRFTNKKMQAARNYRRVRGEVT